VEYTSPFSIPWCVPEKPFQPSLRCGSMAVIDIESRGLYHKALQVSNLWEMDRSRSKLVTFGLDKDTLA